ncbi:hypothetical protein AZ09_04685 [Acetobacter aceti 1023]|nr:hypothetical protein AZ09_04685 [Acetobacter aceti 1023]
MEGLGYLPFGDESGHFLGAVALHRGDRLYREYIDAHGPLVFMLSWLVGHVVGWSQIWLMRLVSTACAAAAGAAIFFSPLFRLLWQRYLACAMWLGTVGGVWVVQGLNLDDYWTIGGALAVIALALLAVPLLCATPVSRTQAFMGGFALGLLPFAAYPFSLFSVAVALAVLGVFVAKPRLYQVPFLGMMAGGLSAVGLMLLWLLVYGDIGGMIAFHFIANQKWYAHYIPMDLNQFWHSLRFSLAPDRIVQTIAVCMLAVGGVLLLACGRHRLMALAVLAGILSLQARGSVGFQNGSFLMASLALGAMLLVGVLASRPKEMMCVVVGCVALAAFGGRHALSSPFQQTAAQRHAAGWHRFRENPYVGFSALIHKYAAPDERILVLPYNPDVYIYANRLSMKKYHAYLPWEADYAAHPWHEYARDICVDLPRNEPPVIYYDHWVVWGSYPAETFMPCFLQVLAKDYTQMPHEPFVYVRNDRLAAHQP